jgi:hypothetical protein
MNRDSMGSVFRKKRFVALLLSTLVVSLISLGVKLPTFCGISLPKPVPRPRAIIVTQIKKCNQVLKQQHDLTETTTVRPLYSAVVTEAEPPTFTSSVIFRQQSGVSSRAPPLA